jgi:tetratricopeptide (TPR) repeat protein
MNELRKLDVTLNMEKNVEIIERAIDSTGLSMDTSGSPRVNDVAASRNMLQTISAKVREAEEYFWRPLDSPRVYSRLKDLAVAVGNKEMASDYESKVRRIEANDLEFLGRVYRFYGNNKRALGYYEKALELVPDHPLAKPDSEKASKAVEKATKELERVQKALDANPQDERALYRQGIAYLSLDRVEEAIESFSAAVRVNPKNADAWAKKGTAFLSLEKYEEAGQFLEKALELKPNSLISKRGLNYIRYFTTGEAVDLD